VRASGEAALRSATATAFTCAATRALYEPYLLPLPCLTLRYGVEIDALDGWRAGFDRAAARRREAIPEDATVILCMGTIEPRKAQTQLIHAFARIAERPPRALLVIVGSRGDEYAHAAESAVAIHGLADRVRIQPVVADPRPSYAMADLMVSASDVESTPRSMLEAMALGVPELIEHGRTGWLCEPRDVVALSEALDRVLELDDEERQAVARSARTLVEQEYRSDTCSLGWEEALRNVASGELAA
jgi:glycosyltransferase involved in cell wall biosynthesis